MPRDGLRGFGGKLTHAVRVQMLPAMLHRLLLSAVLLVPTTATTPLLAQEEPQSNETDAPAATFTDEGVTITLPRERLVEFLVETRGLDALLNLMQYELAKEQARRRGVTVGDAEIEAERRRTLQQAFADQPTEDLTEAEYDQLLEQLLTQQQLSQAEFDVIVGTNAHLRAVAEPAVRERLTDEVLRDAFAARYGEQAKVRVIAMTELADIQQVKQRLDAGEDFETIAREVNVDSQLKQAGGELVPFTRKADYPQAFLDATFGLKPGETSEIIQAGEGLYLVKLEELIPPTAVEFEDVKEALADQIAAEQAQRLIPELRRTLSAALTTEALQIENDTLARQLERRLEALRPQPTDPEALKQQLEAQRPTTQPTTREG